MFSPQQSAVSKGAAELVADGLREAITCGRLAAGEALKQESLATQFGVSHIPVREALQQLAVEGLVTPLRNRGAFVSSLSVEVVQELTEFRCLLEPQLVLWSVPHLTREHHAALRAVLLHIDATADADDLLRLNGEFHRYLYAGANAPYFSASVERVRMNLQRYLRLAWMTTNHKRPSQKSHREIVRLCVKGDSVEAALHVAEHIRDTGSVIVTYLRDHGDGA